MKDLKLSLYPNIRDIECEVITLENVMNGIEKPSKEILETITNLRALKAHNYSKEEYKKFSRELKITLPAVSFCGTFNGSRANIENWSTNTGLICLDIDRVYEDKVNEFKERISEDEHTLAVFISPSGNGLKILLKSQYDSPAQFKSLFKTARNYFLRKYNVMSDEACSDYNRLCFLSYDPEVHINWNAKAFEYEVEEQEEETDNPVTTNHKIKEDVESLIQVIEDNEIDITSEYQDWIKIGFALADEFGEQGREYFHRISSLNSRYEFDECAEQYEQCSREYDNNGVTIKSLFGIAKDHGIIINGNPPVTNNEENLSLEFWYKDGDKTKINYDDLYSFLESKGYCNIRKNGADILARIQHNIIEQIRVRDMRIDALNYVKEYGDIDAVNAFRRNVNNLFSKGQLEMLIEKTPSYLRDTESIVYKPFKNGLVKITKDQIELVPYTSTRHHVWKEDIIDHEYRHEQGTSDFDSFCKLISNYGQDNSRYNSLKSIIGYLSSNYKNPANSKAVILCDEYHSEQPYGGTGKGLLVKGISKLSNTASIHGKGFSFNNGFKYQRVNNKTKLMHFEDVQKNFDFENLFNVITDGIATEKKYENESYIKFEDSPKVIISTNYVVNGTSDSFTRRKTEFELHPYFNAKHTPENEFGRLMFSGWSQTHWNQFYGFMLGCIQEFISVGIIEPPRINIAERQLIHDTSFDFAEWSEKLETNRRYNRADLLEQYRNDVNPFITAKCFYSYLATYANLRGYSIHESRSGNKKFYCFTENKKVEQAA